MADHGVHELGVFTARTCSRGALRAQLVVRDRGGHSNPLLLASVLLTLGLQLLLIYVPVLNRLFDTAALGAADLAVCVGAAALILATVEAEKYLRLRFAG